MYNPHFNSLSLLGIGSRHETDTTTNPSQLALCNLVQKLRNFHSVSGGSIHPFSILEL